MMKSQPKAKKENTWQSLQQKAADMTNSLVPPVATGMLSDWSLHLV